MMRWLNIWWIRPIRRHKAFLSGFSILTAIQGDAAQSSISHPAWEQRYVFLRSSRIFHPKKHKPDYIGRVPSPWAGPCLFHSRPALFQCRCKSTVEKILKTADNSPDPRFPFSLPNLIDFPSPLCYNKAKRPCPNKNADRRRFCHKERRASDAAAED